MDQKLIKLSHSLKNSGFQNESNLILKLSQYDLQFWQDLLTSIKDPIPDEVFQAAKSISQNIADMSKQYAKFQHLSVDELKTAIEMVKSSPKSAQEFNSLTKQAQMDLAKNLWSGTKFIGKGTMKIVPVIGFVFSFLLTLKNFVYSLNSLSHIFQDAQLVGLTWLEALNPAELNEKTATYKEYPKSLETLAKLSKYSKSFADEAISFTSNGIDFIKDVIFIFIDIGSFGWLTVGDISLSVVFMTLEWLAESKTLHHYDSILETIEFLANAKIQEITKNTEPTDEQVLDYFKTKPALESDQFASTN